MKTIFISFSNMRNASEYKRELFEYLRNNNKRAFYDQCSVKVDNIVLKMITIPFNKDEKDVIKRRSCYACVGFSKQAESYLLQGRKNPIDTNGDIFKQILKIIEEEL